MAIVLTGGSGALFLLGTESVWFVSGLVPFIHSGVGRAFLLILEVPRLLPLTEQADGADDWGRAPPFSHSGVGLLARVTGRVQIDGDSLDDALAACFHREEMLDCAA